MKKPPADTRLLTIQLLLKIETRNLPFGIALEDVPPPQRAAVRKLALGVLRHRTLCESAVIPLLKKPSFAHLDVEVAAIFRAAAYEKYFCEAPLYALTNEYTGMARRLKKTSAAALINAVLRRLPEQLPVIKKKNFTGYLEKNYSHPRWMIERWIRQFGKAGCEQLCAADNREAPLCLRVNSHRTTRAKVLLALHHRGITARAGWWTPDSLIVETAGETMSFTEWPEWQRGEIIVQDEAAQMVSILANPQQGQRIYDLCAAPGGKTTHLAAIMGEGEVRAFDLTPKRVQLVRENCTRLGFSKVLLESGDFRSFDLPPADVILLDAPCSGTGTLRRHPDIKWSKSPEQIIQLAQLQRELLNHAATLVRPGGSLVYSTCSIEPEENQLQITAFLQTHSEWHECGRWEHLPDTTADGAFAVRMQRSI